MIQSPLPRSYPWFIGALLLLPLMITHDSLWIDEAQTAAYSRLPDISSVVAKLDADNKTGSLSEGLMPLSMYLAWAWATVLGTSEWALRLPNLFYLAGGLAFIWRAGRSHQIPHLALLVALHPFVWYYADEARPYALQIALGGAHLWAFLKLFETSGRSRKAWLVFLVAGLLLCASSLLCIVPVAAESAVILAFAISARWKPTRFHVMTAAILLPLYLLLGLFYMKALAGASSALKLWEFGPSNIAYSLYELLGFQGLGPSRGELREAARSGSPLGALFLPHASVLGGLVLVWAVTGGIALKAWCQTLRSTVLPSVLVLLLSLAGYTLLGVVMKFPFWGRHLAPLLPFAVFAGAGMAAMARNRTTRICIVTSLGLFWGASAVSIRYAPRFTNDDYRGAARFALEHSRAREVVWWAADTSGARYYGLAPAEPGIPDSFCYSVRNNSTEELQALPQPRWVVFTKADIYDNNGRIMAYLQDGGYRRKRSFTSISIWTR